MFLKAVKEAGEATRLPTASQIAGYGGGMSASASSWYAGGSTAPLSPQLDRSGGQKQLDDSAMDEEETIEIDVYDDIGDTLFVMPDEADKKTGNTRSIVKTMEECSEDQLEIDKKRAKLQKTGPTDERRLYVTLKGDSNTGLAKRMTKFSEGNAGFTKQKPERRRNEANPILAHLNLPCPRHAERQSAVDKNTGNAESGDVLMISSTAGANADAKELPRWGLQIQLPEEDTTDEDDSDEARIDAVLASAQTGQDFDEVILKVGFCWH
ncbi:unnamed protein product [Gongylonema pulchrum]|uniref:Phosphorylated adapter RNA export protein n=1 Tax=Gongylonema pulchrum TaxID=637853 RepID=A0A183CWK3_9BILA|nr:unnamed protein product [Gongylonema pulchrum]